MTLKVHQLAKEMGITSKELTQKALDMGISVKNHMSNLSDEDAERLRVSKKDTAKHPVSPKAQDGIDVSPSKINKPKPPMNRQIVDTAFLEARSKGVKSDKEDKKQPEELKSKESVSEKNKPKESKHEETKPVKSEPVKSEPVETDR